MPGKFAAWVSIARIQWFAARVTRTPGTECAPWLDPPAPQNQSIKSSISASLRISWVETKSDVVSGHLEFLYNILPVFSQYLTRFVDAYASISLVVVVNG
ncbi:hypothetical protein [Nocardia asiatica]|uniref:hypothetical protein n=1 Tax=Nocardia asiatica TaxID=209252 RepID=UPI003EE059A8